jgi:glycosyltransferase involved in cell wall biosynthesis
MSRPGSNANVRYGKILEIGPMPPPHAGWGVRIGYLLEAMHDQGIDSAALDVGKNRRVNRENCETVCSARDYGWKVWRYLWRGYRIHNHLNGDSIKAYGLVLYASFLSLLFRRRSVLTWHGGVPQRWFPRGANRFIDLLQAIIFHLNAKIICNDERIKDHIVAYGVVAEKVLPIPAFSRQYLQFQPVELVPELRDFLGARAPRLVSYVYFRPEFHLDVLVDALKRLAQRFPGFGMVIVGYGEGSQETRQRIAAAHLEDSVRFAGDLNRHEFLTLLSQCDVCIRTPKRDGISSTVLEALALGVPVVAAANALRPPGVVTYPCENARALADAVEQVLQLPPAQRRPAAPELHDTIADELRVLTGSVA